jgi:hypothetical protein
VLAELNKEAAIKLSAADEIGQKRVTLQVKDVPVLEALASLAKLTGSCITEDFFGKGLQLRRSSPGEQPQLVALAGPCVLTIMGTPWSDGGNCALMAYGYGVTRPAPVSVWELTIKDVLDAKGSSVRKEGDTFLFGPSAEPVRDIEGGISSFSVHGSASGFDAEASFPRAVRGTVTLIFAAEAVDVTFDLNADAGQTKKVADVQVIYTGSKTVSGLFGGPAYSLSVTGDLLKVGGFTFEDASGQVVSTVCRSFFSDGKSTSVELEPDGEAKTVTCRVVTKPVTRTYPFEFKDTPKPESHQPPGASEA